MQFKIIGKYTASRQTLTLLISRSPEIVNGTSNSENTLYYPSISCCPSLSVHPVCGVEANCRELVLRLTPIHYRTSRLSLNIVLQQLSTTIIHFIPQLLSSHLIDSTKPIRQNGIGRRMITSLACSNFKRRIRWKL